MANLNMLFCPAYQAFERFILLSEDSLALLLTPGARRGRLAPSPMARPPCALHAGWAYGASQRGSHGSLSV